MQSPLQAPPATTSLEVFLHYLATENVDVVFGVPGGLLHPFFEAVQDDLAIRMVVARHEEGAAFMADGYHRVTGRMAVCAGTSGPGSTNMITGVAAAYADGVPMLVLTGQVPSHAIGRGASQETGREDMDIVAMFAPVTKYSAMVTSARGMPHHVRRALRLALTGRPGPVHLNVPVDLWSETVQEDWFDPTTYRPQTATFDRSAVQRAAGALLRAKRPVFLCGSGVRGAGAREHVRELAEQIGALVATSPRAKGVFPEDHPLSLGVLGYAGHRAAASTVFGDEVDVLFAVASSLNETTTSWRPELRPRDTLIHLDVDADRIGRNYPVDVALVGDAQTILVELLYHLHRHFRDGLTGSSTWPIGDRSTRDADWYLEPELRRSDAVPLTPQRWRADLQSVLPEDAVIFSDVGGHMLFNIHDLRIEAGQDFVVNLGFASMGHGTVAPIGAAVGTDRPVIAIVGDGCFSMNGMDLLTAVAHDIPVLWIVEHNNMHGITWHGSKAIGDRPLDCVRGRQHVDIAGIARAMGLSAWIVDAPGQLGDTVTHALSLRAPCIIEVRVDETVAPPLTDRARSVKGQR